MTRRRIALTLVAVMFLSGCNYILGRYDHGNPICVPGEGERVAHERETAWDYELGELVVIEIDGTYCDSEYPVTTDPNPTTTYPTVGDDT